MIPTSDILPNPDQPRKEFSFESLLELSQSISENGILNPITITFQNDRPVLVAGERRLRAAKIAGIQEIPCIISHADNLHIAILSLIENLQREEMNCFEEAEAINRLIQIYGLTQEEAANKLGCTQPTVANRLRLLRLSPEERKIILSSGLSERHARALLRIEDKVIRVKVINRIVKEKLNVAQTERVIEEILQCKEKRKKPVPLIRDVRLFINTVNHAVDTMRRSGIEASTKKSETEEYIEYYVRIPKNTTIKSIHEKIPS